MIRAELKIALTFLLLFLCGASNTFAASNNVKTQLAYLVNFNFAPTIKRAMTIEQTISNLKIIIFTILLFLATNVSSMETVSSGCRFKAETEKNSHLIKIALGTEAVKCVTFPYLSEYTNPEPEMPLFHAGVDLQANSQSVYSVTSGKVVSDCSDKNLPKTKTGKSACTDSMGIIMIATSVKGVESRVIYVHMSQSLVKVGDTVDIGQPLGTSGNRFGGDPNGAGDPHLHIEVRPNYKGSSAVGRMSCGGPETCITKEKVAAITFDPAEIEGSEISNNSKVNNTQLPKEELESNLELNKIKVAVTSYYNNKGEWSGKFTLQSIERIFIEDRGSDLVAHVKYKYEPVPGYNRRSGYDQRLFFLNKSGGDFVVYKMGPYMSATFKESISKTFEDPIDEVLNISGKWNGYATQGNKKIDQNWELNQNGKKISGIVNLRYANDSASHAIDGNINGRFLDFQGLRFINYNKKFCMASWRLELTSNSHLEGTWGPLPSHPDGCKKGAGGRVYLRNPNFKLK